MPTRVDATTVHGHAAIGVVYDPLVVVAWGGENMLGWIKSDNGPRYRIDNAEMWDRGTGTLRPVDTSAHTYSVYCGAPNAALATMGAGRNSPAYAFAYRLAQETGRRVIIVPNCTGGREIEHWVANSRNSVDWLALEQDLAALFALTGSSRVDYLIGQQGEVDANGRDAAGGYSRKLVTFINQVKASPWWNSRSSHMIFGEPCRAWTNKSHLDYLLTELSSVAAMGMPEVSIANSLAGVGGRQNVLPPADMEANSSSFSGRSLYSMGYFNYWYALPDRLTGPKKKFAELWNSMPWGQDGVTKYPTNGVRFTHTAHLATAPLYTLAPAIAKITEGGSSRLFVGATTNIHGNGENAGTAGRVVWSDDDGKTWQGGTTGGAGIGFIRDGGNVMEPCPWIAPDGKLWVFMNSTANPNVNDGRHGVHICVIDNPMFGSSTIPSPPHPISVIPFGWCQKPQYIKGKWMLPVSYWQSLNNGNDGLVNFVPYLQGRHYFEIDWVNRRLTWAFHMADIDPGHQFDEASIVLLSDGSLQGSWRTLQGPRYAYSSDGGKTWGEGSAFKGLGTQAAGTAAVSKHRAIAGPAGVVMYAWNNAPDRTNLKVALSSGASRIGADDPSPAHAKVLSSGSASYPDILIDGDHAYVVCDDGFGPTYSRSATRRVRLFKFLVSALHTNPSGMLVEETTVIPGI